MENTTENLKTSRCMASKSYTSIASLFLITGINLGPINSLLAISIFTDNFTFFNDSCVNIHVSNALSCLAEL